MTGRGRQAWLRTEDQRLTGGYCEFWDPYTVDQYTVDREERHT